MADKPLTWLGSSLARVRGFPEDARAAAGFQLRRLQSGLTPNDWKPVSSAGPGACEIRIRTALEHRILYVAKFAEAIYVLHAFEKKTKRTPLSDIELARRRYDELVRRRALRKEP
jgi:phage-related protein